MAQNTRRAELIAEIEVLKQEHLDSLSAATFRGWTPEMGVTHDKRAQRLVALQRELIALGPSPAL